MNLFKYFMFTTLVDASRHKLSNQTQNECQLIKRLSSFKVYKRHLINQQKLIKRLRPRHGNDGTNTTVSTTPMLTSMYVSKNIKRSPFSFFTIEHGRARNRTRFFIILKSKVHVFPVTYCKGQLEVALWPENLTCSIKQKKVKTRFDFNCD